MFERIPIDELRRGDEIKLASSLPAIYFVEFVDLPNCVVRPLNEALPDSDAQLGAATTVLDLSRRTFVYRRQTERPNRCSIATCQRPAIGRGSSSNRWLCNAHLQREYQGYDGDMSDPIRPRSSSGEPMQWLRDHVFEEYEPDECLLWPFPLTNGYGQVYDPQRRRPIRVHRYVLELIEGEAVADYWALHTCGTKHCVNPAHLRWVHKRDAQEFQAKWIGADDDV